MKGVVQLLFWLVAYGRISEAANVTNITDWIESRQIKNLITALMPKCFDPTNVRTIDQTLTCLRDNANPACFNVTTLNSIKTCILTGLGLSSDFFQTLSTNTSALDQILSNSDQLSSMLGSFASVTLGCLDPLVGCVNAYVQNVLVPQVDPVLKAKLDLIQKCGSEHGECAASCIATIASYAQGNKNLYIGTNLSLATCSGIQTALVNPDCEVVSCCPPCVRYYEDMMDYLVNRVLRYVPYDCSFSCPFRRRLEQAFVSERGLVDTSNSSVDSCVQFVPSLTGKTQREMELRSPYFNPCVTTGYVKSVLNAPARNMTGTQKTSSSSLLSFDSIILASILFVMVLH